jgi:IstB-like ATP binding protein
VGKSHLAIGLGVKAVEAGHSVLFLTLESLMGRLVRARHENRLERILQQLAYPRVLILDELGYLPLTREEASLFFRLLVRRYEWASLIVTSNKSFVDWGEVFNDQILATAILDRLLHHATTVNIKGDSYRLREKKKAGLLGRKPKPAGELERWEPSHDCQGTRTSVNRGHLTSVFSGQRTSALTVDGALAAGVAVLLAEPVDDLAARQGPSSASQPSIVAVHGVAMESGVRPAGYRDILV